MKNLFLLASPTILPHQLPPRGTWGIQLPWIYGSARAPRDLSGAGTSLHIACSFLPLQNNHGASNSFFSAVTHNTVFVIPPSSQKLCDTPYPFTMFPCYVKGVPLGVLSNFQRSDILSAMFKPRVSLSHCYPISHKWESLHNFSILYIYITCCLKLTVRFRELIYSQLSLMLYIYITCCLNLHVTSATLYIYLTCCLKLTGYGSEN